jgi:hypothetical protein
MVDRLDTDISRAQAAGIYVHPRAAPQRRALSWTSANPTEVERYATYGQTLTTYLANRYGNPASPRFTKAVLGFGLT